MSELRILHLYPETLKLNGEVGNITALRVRAEASGLTVRVKGVETGQELPARRPHVVFLGSGTLSATKIAQSDLIQRDSQIHRWVAAGTKVLAVGSGFDLISRGLEVPGGELLDGLGLTNTLHKISANYQVGEVSLSKGLAGYINSDRIISRGHQGFELGVVLASDNRELLGYIDGYVDGKVMASNVQGPLLPMNPQLADLLLTWVYPELGKPSTLRRLDKFAKQARLAISRRVGN